MCIFDGAPVFLKKENSLVLLQIWRHIKGNRETKRQIDRQAERQIDKKDRQTDTERGGTHEQMMV